MTRHILRVLHLNRKKWCLERVGFNSLLGLCWVQDICAPVPWWSSNLQAPAFPRFSSQGSHVLYLCPQKFSLFCCGMSHAFQSNFLYFIQRFFRHVCGCLPHPNCLVFCALSELLNTVLRTHSFGGLLKEIACRGVLWIISYILVHFSYFYKRAHIL